MATKAKAKRKTTKRKKSRTSSVSGPKKTITEGGIRFSLNQCSTTVGGAKSIADKLRAKGYTARVKGKCVYKGRKAKK